MSWLKIDDNVPQHPKVLDAGPEAAWLWLSAIAYSRRNLTDGFIPRPGLATLGPFRQPQRLAERLVTVRLFERVNRGYRIHDYLDHNPSRDQVQESLRAEAERKAAARDRYRPPNVRADSGRTPDGQKEDAAVLRSVVSSRARVARAESESESEYVHREDPTVGGALPTTEVNPHRSDGTLPRARGNGEARQEHRAETRGQPKKQKSYKIRVVKPSFAQLCAMVKAERDAHPDETQSDLTERLKHVCARAGFRYRTEDLWKALDALERRS